MVVHNPNNWHWVDKNCLPWTKDYFNENIINTSVETGALSLLVSEISSITGDCDVTQRKGKVLCIYDMKVEFAIKGSKNDEDFTGKIILPEFIHDQDDDEYIFEITSDNKSEVKTLLIPVLLAKLKKFQKDLLEAHGKDVQHTSN